MAMKECGECGREVSTKAESCPNCGAKIGSNFSILRVLLLVFSILVLLPIAFVFGGIVGLIIWGIWIIILLAAK